MCYLLFQTNEPTEMNIVGISRDKDGVPYGTFTAPAVHNFYVTPFASHRACVLARCPTFDTNYTEVHIQIAYEKRSQCRIG